MLYRAFVCNRFATGARFVTPPHAFFESGIGRVEVGRRLFQARMPEHVLDMMYRPARLDEARPRFVSQVMEMEIDGQERRA